MWLYHAGKGTVLLDWDEIIVARESAWAMLVGGGEAEH
jgi:hypothetical protein